MPVLFSGVLTFIEDVATKISIAKSKFPWRPFKFRNMGKAKKFKKVDPLPVDPNGLSGLVIAVSGTIPGTTHGQFRERPINLRKISQIGVSLTQAMGT